MQSTSRSLDTPYAPQYTLAPRLAASPRSGGRRATGSMPQYTHAPKRVASPRQCTIPGASSTDRRKSLRPIAHVSFAWGTNFISSDCKVGTGLGAHRKKHWMRSPHTSAHATNPLVNCCPHTRGNRQCNRNVQTWKEIQTMIDPSNIGTQEPTGTKATIHAGKPR